MISIQLSCGTEFVFLAETSYHLSIIHRSHKLIVCVCVSVAIFQNFTRSKLTKDFGSAYTLDPQVLILQL